MSQPSTAPNWEARLRTVALAAALGLGGLVLGIVFINVAAVVLIFGGVISSQPSTVVTFLLSTVFMQGFAFFGVAYAYGRRRGDVRRYVNFSVPSLRQFGIAVGGLVASIAALLVVSILIRSSGVPSAQNDIAVKGMAHPASLLALIPLAFLLVGPGEEVLFRGVVQETIRERFGAVPAVVLGSIVFASAHFLSLTGPLPGRVVTISALSVISLVLGAAYEYTDNLTVPALIHGGYDAIQFASLYASTTGGSAGATLGVLGVHAGALATLVAALH